MQSQDRRLIISSRCAQTILVQRNALAQAAKAAGWDVTLAGDARGQDAYVRRLRDRGFEFEALPVEQRSMNPISLIRLFLYYIRLFQKTRPLVFHAFTIKPTIAGTLAAAVLRVPLRIVTVAGLGHLFLSQSRVKRMVGVGLFRLALAKAHRILFYNSDDLRLFRELRILPLDRGELTEGGSGVDTSHFRPTPSPVSSPPFVIVFIGRLLVEKGVRELLAAARILLAKAPNVRIEIVGNIDLNNPSSVAIDEIIAATHTGNIVWHGAVSDVRPHMARAHAVILPSYREGLPMALLEGAAMGRALLAADVPGCRDAVRHGITGLLFAPRDSKALAGAIIELSKDPQRAAVMGASARADALKRFDTNVVTRATLDRYRVVTD